MESTQKVAAASKPRGRRPGVTTAQKIAEAEQLLAQLKEQARQEEKEGIERNRRAVLDLLRGERLDLVSVERWREALPRLAGLLGNEATSSAENRRDNAPGIAARDVP